MTTPLTLTRGRSTGGFDARSNLGCHGAPRHAVTIGRQQAAPPGPHVLNLAAPTSICLAVRAKNLPSLVLWFLR